MPRQHRLVGLVVPRRPTAPGPPPAGGAGRSSACPRRPWLRPDGDVSTGSAGSSGGPTTGRALGGERVAGRGARPAWPRAAMSPAGDLAQLDRAPCPAARTGRAAARRRAVRGLASMASGRIVPDSTLNMRDLADVRVGDGLEDVGQRLAAGVGRAPRSRCRRPGPSTGGRSAGDGPISQMKSASRSIADALDRRAADDREHRGRGHAVGQRLLQLLELGTSPSR